VLTDETKGDIIFLVVADEAENRIKKLWRGIEVVITRRS
jgi:hypothetical protein